jgi:hypothetical protein
MKTRWIVILTLAICGCIGSLLGGAFFHEDILSLFDGVELTGRTGRFGIGLDISGNGTVTSTFLLPQRQNSFKRMITRASLSTN